MVTGLLNPSRFASSGGGGAAAYYAAVLADSPWAAYKTDEVSGSSFADYSGNARSLTKVGTPTLAQLGPGSSPLNDAIGFTSATNEYASTTATSNHGALTYEAWVNLPALPSGVNPILARSIGYLSSGASDAELYVKTDGKIEWSVFDNVTTRTITSSAAISLNTYHHIVCSVGAAGMKIRIDKVTVASNASWITAYTGASQNVFLRGGGSRMNGHDALKIARPSIFTSQLSDARADAHYDAA